MVHKNKQICRILKCHIYISMHQTMRVNIRRSIDTNYKALEDLPIGVSQINSQTPLIEEIANGEIEQRSFF